MLGDCVNRSSRFAVLYSQVYGSKKQRVWREGTLSVNFHTASLFDTENQNKVAQFRGSGITPNCAYKKMVEADNGLSWTCGTEVRIGVYNVQIENVLELHLVPITASAPYTADINMEIVTKQFDDNTVARSMEKNYALEIETNVAVLPVPNYVCTLHGSKRTRDCVETPEVLKVQQQNIYEEMQIGMSKEKECSINENVDRFTSRKNEYIIHHNINKAANYNVEEKTCNANNKCNNFKANHKRNHLPPVTPEQKSCTDVRSNNCNNNYVEMSTSSEELQTKSYDDVRTNNSGSYHKRNLTSLRHELQNKYAHCLESMQQTLHQ